MPRCATTDLPPTVRGVLEHNLRSDLEDRDGLLRFEAYYRHRTEGEHPAKRPECHHCADDADCPGVWTRYIEVHGWDGLEPVEG